MIPRIICGLLMALSFSSVTLAKSPFVDCAVRTGQNASIFVRADIAPTVNGLSLETGDEIVALDSEGTCVGKAVWQGTTAAITVWGDDDMTPQKDGLAIGEEIRFIVFDVSENLIFGYQEDAATIDLQQDFPFKSQPEYEPDALYSVAYFDVHGEPTVPETPNSGFSLSSPSPNPFNPSTSFNLRLDEPQDVAIRVYNALGRQVAIIHEGLLAANVQHRFRFEGQDYLTSGVYFFRVRGEKFATVQSVVLLK